MVVAQRVQGGNEQSINPPLDTQDEVGAFDIEAKPDLFLVARGPRSLEPLVPPRPRQRAVRPDEVALAAEVAPAQSKLD